MHRNCYYRLFRTPPHPLSYMVYCLLCTVCSSGPEGEYDAQFVVQGTKCNLIIQMLSNRKLCLGFRSFRSPSVVVVVAINHYWHFVQNGIHALVDRVVRTRMQYINRFLKVVSKGAVDRACCCDQG